MLQKAIFQLTIQPKTRTEKDSYEINTGVWGNDNRSLYMLVEMKREFLTFEAS